MSTLQPNPILEPYDEDPGDWLHCPRHATWYRDDTGGCEGCVDQALAEQAEHDEGWAALRGEL